ncbi:hypothetical protein EI94DRAFT_1697235 [Lactarius quietus]|nr:hypothetical protein EI94DRAFT_1697235 [Lactarius quietus]
MSYEPCHVAIHLTTEERDPAIALVHIVGLITNKGQHDRKIGAQEHEQAFELGEGISQYDVDAFMISLTGAQQECAQFLDEDVGVTNVLSATYQKQKSHMEVFKQWVAMKDKPSCSSFCTALWLAVGHSFPAEYTRCFKKQFEPLTSSDEAQIDNRWHKTALQIPRKSCHSPQAHRHPMAPGHPKVGPNHQQMVLG